MLVPPPPPVWQGWEGAGKSIRPLARQLRSAALALGEGWVGGPSLPCPLVCLASQELPHEDR